MTNGASTILHLVAGCLRWGKKKMVKEEFEEENKKRV